MRLASTIPLLAAAMLLSALLPAQDSSTAMMDRRYASRLDIEREAVMAAREADWRNGPVVYQVLVDRFAPPEDLDAKRHLYPEPKRLRDWSEVPVAGTYNEEVRVWSHEIDFWGGDLQSLRANLDYLVDLGVDVLYLNPIHLAYTNHKYDAQDYFAISPEYGTHEDVKELADALHERDMKLVLDGVFNHMGRTSPFFQEAMEDEQSPWREWFFIGDEYELGYRAWWNVANLPEVRLESEAVRKRLYKDDDSVVQQFLRDGADGWRLDVAFDIGQVVLEELTQYAHEAKPGSLVLGEIYNYPEEWSPALDGGLNMTVSKQILAFVRGELQPRVFAGQLDQMIKDAGLETLLKWWIVLDNHDRRRLHTELPETWQRRMAQVLQFTLPGAPCIYYGVEVGMTGGDDPQQRGPFRWDLVGEENEEYIWATKLIDIRSKQRALRLGDYRRIESASTLAFLRRTERVAETVLVIANPGDEPAREVLMIRESKIMDNARLRDLVGGMEVQVSAGVATFEVPARTTLILVPVIQETHEYSHYGRVY